MYTPRHCPTEASLTEKAGTKSEVLLNRKLHKTDPIIPGFTMDSRDHYSTESRVLSHRNWVGAKSSNQQAETGGNHPMEGEVILKNTIKGKIIENRPQICIPVK